MANHHLEEGNRMQYESLARFLSGNAVGLVLGGGGARGLAHGNFRFGMFPGVPTRDKIKPSHLRCGVVVTRRIFTPVPGVRFPASELFFAFYCFFSLSSSPSSWCCKSPQTGRNPH